MTIICRSRDFIFVHLPKCGGTSVEQAFAPHAGWRDLIVGSTAIGEALHSYYKWRYHINKHSSARYVRRAVKPDFWTRAWKVALVRHPLRRFESLYGWVEALADEYRAEHKLDRAQFAAIAQSGRLKGFLGRSAIVKAYAAAESFSEFVRELAAHKFFLQNQTQRLSDKGGLIVDDVFRLEEIDRFWEALEQRTGIKLERLHTNRTAPKLYEWDNRALDAVTRRFRQDFVSFGYELP